MHDTHGLSRFSQVSIRFLHIHQVFLHVRRILISFKASSCWLILYLLQTYHGLGLLVTLQLVGWTGHVPVRWLLLHCVWLFSTTRWHGEIVLLMLGLLLGLAL